MATTITLEEVIQQMRGLLSRAAVTAVTDSGRVQTANLTTHDGADRSQIPVWQPYGHASLPPDPEAFVMAGGGDQGALFALLLSAAYRFGNLQPGESVLFTHEGSRLHLQAGGNGMLTVANLLALASGAMTITTTGGLTVKGPVVFDQPVTFQDAVTFAKPVVFQQGATVQGELVAPYINRPAPAV